MNTLKFTAYMHDTLSHFDEVKLVKPTMGDSLMSHNGTFRLLAWRKDDNDDYSDSGSFDGLYRVV